MTPEQRAEVSRQLSALGVPALSGGYVWNATNGTLCKPPEVGSDVWEPIPAFKVGAVVSVGWVDDNGRPVEKGGTSQLIVALELVDGTPTTAKFTGLSSKAFLDQMRAGVTYCVEHGLVFGEMLHNVRPRVAKNDKGRWNEPQLFTV